MSKITQILAEKDVPATEKLEAVKEIVAAAREKYSNTDVEIEDVKVNTAYGAMPFSALEPEGQVQLLAAEAAKIKAAAVSYVEMNPGTVINQKVTELLAINPLFANVTTESGYDFL